MKYGQNKLSKHLTVLPAIGSAILLTACAGGAGSASSNSGSSEDASYSFDASQSEVNESISGLEPVTLVYQDSASSEGSPSAAFGKAIKESIEERSNGQITIDIVWAESVADYNEVNDALADGRLDLAYTLPTYEPDAFPAVNAIANFFGEISPSPFEGEMLAAAVSADLGWNTPEVLDEYEAAGIFPLIPIVPTASYVTACNEEGTEADDWDGRQVRVGSTYLNSLMTHVGATPTSMAYTEMYEALQRKTVNCTLAPPVSAAEGGIFEVAPHVGYTTSTSFARAAAGFAAGTKYDILPTAYKQIIFDSYTDYFQGQMMQISGGNAEAVDAAKEAGGTIDEIADDTQSMISDFNSSLNDQLRFDDAAGSDAQDRVNESIERWEAQLSDLGYEDAGSFDEFDEWFDPSTDFTAFADKIYEEVFLAHRPE